MTQTSKEKILFQIGILDPYRINALHLFNYFFVFVFDVTMYLSPTSCV